MQTFSFSYVFILLLGSIATLRISEIIVKEDIFLSLRERLGIHDTGRIVSVIKTENQNLRYFLGRLFSCIGCTSVWVGFILIGLFLISPNLYLIITGGFIMSKVAIWLNKVGF